MTTLNPLEVYNRFTPVKVISFHSPLGEAWLTCIKYVNTCLYEVKHGRTVHTKEHYFECLCPNFGWTTTNYVRTTLENTTQFSRAQDCYPMGRHYKTHFPATTFNWLNETVVTDIFFSDVPLHGDGI
jgi:hypothetical protein